MYCHTKCIFSFCVVHLFLFIHVIPVEAVRSITVFIVVEEHFHGVSDFRLRAYLVLCLAWCFDDLMSMKEGWFTGSTEDKDD